MRSTATECSIEFDNASRAMGGHLTHEALTAACQTEGDLSIVIGFAPTEKQARKAARGHARGGGQTLLVEQLDAARAARSARRSARRR